MDTSALRFAAPATNASANLNRLLDGHDRVRDALRSAERAAGFASEEHVAASAALAELERRRAGGDDVPAAEVKRAETALRQAQATASEPWPERRRGLTSAMRDASAAVSHYVGQHFAELAKEVEAAAVDAAERVNVALEEIAAAYAEREHVSAHSTALLGQVDGPRAGAVPLSRVENVVRAAQAVLLEGGELVPTAQRREVPQAVEA